MSMQAADFHIDTSAGKPRLALCGDWTAVALGQVGERLTRALRGATIQSVGTEDLGRFDTTGAHALLKATGGALPPGALAERPPARRILDLVSAVDTSRPPSAPRPAPNQKTQEK